MGLEEWLRRFRGLHARAMKGELQGGEAAEYRTGCDELARALIAAQKLALRPGEGFSVLLGKIPGNEEHTATLRVPGGKPIVGTVRPGEAKQQPGNFRVAFLYQQLPDAERQQLEMLVIDTALSQLAG